MGRAQQDALLHRYHRDKSDLKAAKAALRHLVQKRLKAIKKKHETVSKARAAVEAAGMDTGSDLSDVELEHLLEGGAENGEDDTDKAGHLDDKGNGKDEDDADSSSESSSTSSEAPPVVVRAPQARPVEVAVPAAVVPAPPVAAQAKAGRGRGRPRKQTEEVAAAPKPEPSPRRAVNAAGTQYPGYAKTHPAYCSACEQLLKGMRNATAKHLPACEWRARKVRAPKPPALPQPAA